MSSYPCSFRSVLLATALLLGVGCGEQTLKPAAENVATTIDDALKKAFPSGGPGAAVLVVHKGKVILRQGYGSANLELGVAMKPEHVFRLGSITKQFTAVAILQLVEAGKLSLDDDITTHVPGAPTGGHKITLRHLLTHTSGLPSFTDQPAWRAAPREDMSLEQTLDYIKDIPAHFEPGANWAYSNTGYRLLGAVVENVSGLSYARYVAERIFKPAGMNHSSYDETSRITPLRVAGYTTARTGAVTNAAFVSMTQPHGAGALMSNVDDLRRWHEALLAGQLLSRELVEHAHTSMRLADGRDTGYGFGWSVSFTAGHRTVEHGGGIQGFSTHALSIPDAELFVVVLCNSDRPGKSPSLLVTEIAEMMLGAGATAIKVPVETLQSYVGVYRAPHEKIAFTIQGDQLEVSDQSGRTFGLTALSPDQFFAPKVQMRYTFIPDPDRAERKRVRLKPRGNVESFAVPIDEALRPPPAVVPIATLERYIGAYEIRPNAIVTVRRDVDSLTAEVAGRPVVTLMPESPTLFRVKQGPATIEFKTDDSGAVNGLVMVQNGRVTPAKRVP